MASVGACRRLKWYVLSSFSPILDQVLQTLQTNLKPENEDPFMILIREVSVRLYGFTDEKQSKAWQLLCSQRDHSPV